MPGVGVAVDQVHQPIVLVYELMLILEEVNQLINIYRVSHGLHFSVDHHDVWRM